ncbi:MAG TPA: PqqD family protein [Candidatus Acidoferrum sp.]|nr:PqqD family protein [Candidatus Acidoferrum sp.]
MFQVGNVDVRFVRNSAVVSRKIAEETLIVPIRGGVGDLDSIFSLNPLGSDLWALLESGASQSTMADWVVERYEVMREQAIADIRDFLNDLEGAGLVKAHQEVGIGS